MIRIKASVVRVLLFVHLFLFFWAVVIWGGGYVSLAHHRHEGVAYELIELFAPDYWRYPHATMVPREVRSVSTSGIRHDGDWSVRIVWRGTLEQNLEWISQAHDTPDFFKNLSWVEGVERSGNPEPTLIAWGTGKAVHEWYEFVHRDRPEQDRHRSGRDSFEFSLRIYNFDRFWLVWSKFTHIPPPNVQVYGKGGGLQDWSLWSSSEVRTAADIFGRFHLYRRGGVSPGFLLPILAMPPRDIRQFVSPLAEREFYWLLPPPQSAWGPYDTPYFFGLQFLAMLTALYRHLFYLPLALVPSVLAWPFAVLYALFLLGSFVWCAVRWYQLGRRGESL